MCDISCRGSWAAFDRSGGREQLVAGKHGRASMGLTAGGGGGEGGGGEGGEGGGKRRFLELPRATPGS